MLQRDVIERLVELVHQEHCSGCDSNTCDITVAYRLGYTQWAVAIYAGAGASSQEFDKLYAKLGPRFAKDAEAERVALCEEHHVSCENCNAVLWLPDECDYYCDNCGRTITQPTEPEDTP